MTLDRFRNSRFPWALVLAAAAAGTLALRASDVPARPSPDWLRNGVIYEVFPRDFSPAGNLAAVTARLDDLQKLGVTILWTMPIHPIGEKARKGEFGSPYSVRNYYAVDPHYGTVEDYKALVTAAHQRGLKVIMDLVANHTAWDSAMMTNKDFYKQDSQGRVISPVPDWSDVAGLNYANPALRQYMIAMLEYWVRECDVDGFRCDAAPMVPRDFWEQARTALAAAKPDIMLLDEGEEPQLLERAFDLDYSWKLMWTLNDVISHNAPASNLRRSWEESRAQYPKDALRLRISDDHDETRAIARYGMNGAAAASVLMFTLDGVPLLYNGMEVGDATESADPALFDKLTICWHPHQSQRPNFPGFYHDLIQLRERHAAFRTANVAWLRNSSEDTLVTYLRTDDKDEFLVAVNFSSRPVEGTIEVKDAGGFRPMALTGAQNYSPKALPAVQLDGFEWRIYRRAAGAVAAK